MRQRIYAKAWRSADKQDKPVLLITADTLCIPDSLAERLAARLKEKAGVPRERIAFTATHTHTAPMIRDVAADDLWNADPRRAPAAHRPLQPRV